MIGILDIAVRRLKLVYKEQELEQIFRGRT